MFEQLRIDAGRVAWHSQEAAAACSDPERSPPVDQELTTEAFPRPRLAITDVRWADAVKRVAGVGNPDRPREVFPELSASHRIDQRETPSSGVAPIQTRRCADPQRASRVAPQGQDRCAVQSFVLSHRAPALTVVLREPAMTRHPDCALLVLNDGGDTPFGKSIPRRELCDRVSDNPRHAADCAETDPQAAVVRREDGRDTVVRQRLATCPRKELRSVETHQSRSGTKPQVSVTILRNGIDAEWKRTLFLGPVGQRVVGE